MIGIWEATSMGSKIVNEFYQNYGVLNLTKLPTPNRIYSDKFCKKLKKKNRINILCIYVTA